MSESTTKIQNLKSKKYINIQIRFCNKFGDTTSLLLFLDLFTIDVPSFLCGFTIVFNYSNLCNKYVVMVH
jgi:hypothetical protein